MKKLLSSAAIIVSVFSLTASTLPVAYSATPAPSVAKKKAAKKVLKKKAAKKKVAPRKVIKKRPAVKKRAVKKRSVAKKASVAKVPSPTSTDVVPVVTVSAAGRVITINAIGGSVVAMINGVPAIVGPNTVPPGNDLVIVQFQGNIIYNRVFTIQ